MGIQRGISQRNSTEGRETGRNLPPVGCLFRRNVVRWAKISRPRAAEGGSHGEYQRRGHRGPHRPAAAGEGLEPGGAGGEDPRDGQGRQQVGNGPEPAGHRLPGAFGGGPGLTGFGAAAGPPPAAGSARRGPGGGPGGAGLLPPGGPAADPVPAAALPRGAAGAAAGGGAGTLAERPPLPAGPLPLPGGGRRHPDLRRDAGQPFRG